MSQAGAKVEPLGVVVIVLVVGVVVVGVGVGVEVVVVVGKEVVVPTASNLKQRERESAHGKGTCEFCSLQNFPVTQKFSRLTEFHCILPLLYCYSAASN